MKAIFLFMLFFLPVFGFSQVYISPSVVAAVAALDSAEAVKLMNKIISASQTFTDIWEFDMALEINDVAEKIALEKWGRESAAYGRCCFNHGRILHYKKTDYPEAEKWYLESKIILENVLGEENPEYAMLMWHLGAFYREMGNYEKAESLFVEALASWKERLGKENPEYAVLMLQLGGVYWEMGNYEKAEPLLVEALAIQEKTLDKEHPYYVYYICGLRDLAVLYQEMGNYKKAESLLVEALAIQEKVLRIVHSYYAICLENLAGLYSEMDNYEKVEPECFGAFTAWGVELGILAYLYAEMGDYKKAEPLLIESLTILEKALGKEHFIYANSLCILAYLYAEMGDYKKAEPLLIESLTILEKALGKEHPEYVANLNNLTLLYWEMGKYEKAKSFLFASSKIEKSLLKKASLHLSERELFSYRNTFADWNEAMLSFAQIQPGMSASCYNNTLFHKGFLLNVANQIKRLALSDSLTTKKFNLLKSYGHRLAKEYAKPIAERDSAHVAEWEEEANTLEKELARSVAGFGEALQQTTWQDVQAKLKPGEAAIEFVHYRYYTPNLTDSIFYSALVVQPSDTTPHFVTLFEERELTALLKDITNSTDYKIGSLYTFQEKGKSLNDLIWKPLKGFLKDASTVYCSPSGLLHKINLGAVPLDERQTFAERRRLVLVGSTRQVVLPNTASFTSNDAYLVGGVHYELDSTAIGAANQSILLNRGMPAFDQNTFYQDSSNQVQAWMFLDSTLAEVIEAGQTLRTAAFSLQLDTGYLATEDRVRHRCGFGNSQSSPRVLHFATHGFFYPDPKREVKRDLMHSELSGPVFKISDNPMMRSGLVLAGGNHAWRTGKPIQPNMEDGILTAYEASQLNLSGTELVVLSACNTGLGDIVGNEGVYGLQRAFKIAGAKYLVMNLWEVNDLVARVMMTEFYYQWLQVGLAIPDAFRTAQAKMKEKYKDPYLWACFVLVE